MSIFNYPLKNTLSLLTLASVLAGCAAFPDDYERDIGVPQIVEQYEDEWSHHPALRYVPSSSGAHIDRYFSLPEEVARQRIFIDLSYDVDATTGDLINALRSQGYNIVSQLNESQVANLALRHFSGELGDFVDKLSQYQNIAYEYRNGVLFILEANRYSVSLPQHEELLLQVAASLAEMGVTDVRTDILTGMVSFSAKPDVSGYATEYLKRVAENSAMVRLQVAVVTVGLNRGLSRGLDWSSIIAKAGTKGMRPADTGDAAGGEGAAAYALGQAASFLGSSGFAYAFNSNSFSLSAVVKALSEYGTARTEQNVELGTVSGMPVRISSGNDIPYVKSIGSATASGGSTSGSTDTEIVRSGLEIKITPNFDSFDKSIVTTVNVNMSSLVGFRELSAGTNLGTLSQPEMQNLEFDNVGRLRAGETIIIGGITYDQLSDSYNNLPYLERVAVGSKTQKVEKNAIYIVIRPTVTVFSRHAEALNAELAARQKEQGKAGRAAAYVPEEKVTLRPTLSLDPKPQVSPVKRPLPKIVAPKGSDSIRIDADELTSSQAHRGRGSEPRRHDVVDPQWHALLSPLPPPFID